MALIGFPDPVDEVSARLVAGGVVTMVVATIALDQPWLAAVVALGFVARVLTGPKLSPLGRVATQVVRPRLPVAPRPVPGPPKRFAQGIGAVLSVTAVVFLALGAPAVGYFLLGALAVAAGLEAFAGVCLGCHIFAVLMRAGVIPAEVCERCADLWGTAGRPPATASGD
jgi:Domain of unknown function (DUF4395)